MVSHKVVDGCEEAPEREMAPFLHLKELCDVLQIVISICKIGRYEIDRSVVERKWLQSLARRTDTGGWHFVVFHIISLPALLNVLCRVSIS
jgi:hypothetical protein